MCGWDACRISEDVVDNGEVENVEFASCAGEDEPNGRIGASKLSESLGTVVALAQSDKDDAPDSSPSTSMSSLPSSVCPTRAAATDGGGGGASSRGGGGSSGSGETSPESTIAARRA